MANTLGNYNPIFYANEALIHLRKVLGMANRVHRGYELERRARNVGQVISIRKPGTFVAQDPISAAQDILAETVNITLDQNPGVAYTLTDVELAFTGEQIISEHIEPAAYAIADQIDQTLAALYVEIPWVYDYAALTDHQIITGVKSVMFNNNAYFEDGNMHLMVDGTVQMNLENSETFHSAAVTGAGQNQTLLRGGLGTRFGYEIFANQNTPVHTAGTASSGAGDNLGTVNDNPLLIGATTMTIASLTEAETLVAGDTFVIAGNDQRYTVVTGGTVAAITFDVTITFSPPAAQQYAQGAVVTISKSTALTSSQLLGFHRNAFALAMAPLPDRLPGIEVAVATDPVTGISLRARRWSTGIPAASYVALDALYGVKVLDANLAVRAFT